MAPRDRAGQGNLHGEHEKGDGLGGGVADFVDAVQGVVASVF